MRIYILLKFFDSKIYFERFVFEFNRKTIKI